MGNGLEGPKTEVERSMWRFLPQKLLDIMAPDNSNGVAEKWEKMRYISEVEPKDLGISSFEDKRVPFWTS